MDHHAMRMIDHVAAISAFRDHDAGALIDQLHAVIADAQALAEAERAA